MPKLRKPAITAKQEAQLRSVELPGKFADHLRAIALGDKPLPDAPGERHEALLALGENYAALALDRFLVHPEELTEDDRLDLAFFVGMQEQRGPGFLTELKARMEESTTMHAAVRLTTNPVIAR